MDNNIKFTDCSPIFVVGAGRSGTTLLQLMLNAHPNIAVMGELHYFDEILQIKKIVPLLDSPKKIELFFSLIKKIHSVLFLPNIEQILNEVKLKMEIENECTYEKFYRYVLEEFAKSKKANRFGEKTPPNIRYIKQLFEMFPNSKIIHIVRDPRDVIASSIKMHWIANDVVINVLKWKCEILYSKQFSKKNSYMEVLYEELIYNPEEQLRNICVFIGEEYDSKMMEYYKTAKSYVKNEPWKVGTNKPANTSAIGRWKRELNKGQVFIIEQIVGSQMDKFGYEKTKTNFGTKLLTTFVLLQEMLKYIRYKYQEKKVLHKKYPNTIFFGKTKGYYKFCFKNLFKN